MDKFESKLLEGFHMSNIYVPATKPEDWSRYLDEPKHWKKGFSAMSLAMCWQEVDGFPETVTTVFSQSSTKHLASLVLNKHVDIVSYDTDRFMVLGE